MPLAVCRHDLVRVAAIADRLHAVFRVEFLQIWNAAPAHHSGHAAGLLRQLWRLAWLGYLAEKRKQVGARSRILHSLERHMITRNEPLRILYPLVERLVIPSDIRRFQRIGITLEALQAACSSVPNIGEARAGHVAVGFERVTWGTCAKCALAPLVALRLRKCRLAPNRAQQGDHRKEKRTHCGLHGDDCLISLRTSISAALQHRERGQEGRESKRSPCLPSSTPSRHPSCRASSPVLLR